MRQGSNPNFDLTSILFRDNPVCYPSAINKPNFYFLHCTQN